MQEWNEDDNGFDRQSHGGGSHATQFGHTSSFSTTILSKDNRFFGIKLSPELASNFRQFYPMVLDWARRKGQQIGVPLAEKFGTKFLEHTAEEAQRFGGKAGNVIGYGIILSKQIADIGGNVYDSTKSLNDLRVAVKPLTRSKSSPDMSSPLSGGNEVVANARGKVNSVFWQRMLENLTGTIAVAPALFFMWNEQSAKNKRQEKYREHERAKGDVNKIADLMEKDLHGGGSHIAGTADEIRAAKELVIERHRSEYKRKKETYLAEKIGDAKAKLEESLKGLTAQNVEAQIETLRRQGLDTRSLHSNVEEIVARDHDQNTINRLLEQEIEQFKKINRNRISTTAERSLTAQFVRENDAFDSNDLEILPYEERYGRHGEGPRLIKHELEEQLRERQEALRKEESENKQVDEKGSEVAKLAAGLASGLAAEFTTQRLMGKAAVKYAQPIALDRILHLRRALEQSGDEPPETVPGIEGEKTRGDDMGYVQYVHSIFQQHQKDSSRAAIGERFFEHFEQAGWNDSAIQQLPDEQLTTYEYAVKTIAKRIKDGRMDAIALINLVGDRHNKIVKNSGRAFGPQGTTRDDAAAREAILHVIDNQTALAHAGHAKSDSDINEKLGNFIFSVEDVKHALASESLDKEQRAFIFTLFSDVVGNDAQLCKLLGIDEKRCQELRREQQETFNDKFDGAVMELADRIQNNPDTITKEIKLTEKEKQLVLSLADRIREDGKHTVDLTENRQDLKAMETVVANAAMVMSKGHSAGKPNFLNRILERAKEVPEILADAKKRREEQAKETQFPPPAHEQGHMNGETSHFTDQAPLPRSKFTDENTPAPLTERTLRTDESLVPGARR